VNALKQRELDLRGNKIPMIENLGATEDQYDCLDLSDNEIRKLENFPLLKRLVTLLMSNNRIQRIGPALNESLPQLEMLVLTNNNLTQLPDLDPLAALNGSLRNLSLLDNPVTKKPHYRLYVIHKLPRLRVLDFKKVKYQERKDAEKVFGGEAGQSLKKDIAKTYVPGEIPDDSVTTAKQMEQLRAVIEQAIKNAKSVDEVTELEAALAAGRLPPHLAHLQQHNGPQKMST
jgi:U2 small nuclear ribonucleoprotein A'